MRKCKNGHEMEHTGKHCGECGSVEAPAAMHKCNCGQEFIKSAATKFSPCCGAALEPAEDLGQALDGVAAFLKARGAVEADLADLPEVPHVDVDDDEVRAILKAATQRDTDGTVLGLRPDPLFEAVLAGQASVAADARALAGHQQKWNEHHAAGSGVLMKAVSAMGDRIVALEAQLVEQGGRSRGRKAGGDIAGDAARAAAGAEQHSAATDGRLRGHALLAKCRQAAEANPAQALSIEEVGALEQHANMGHSVVEIFKSKRPALARRAAELAGEEMPTRDELTVH